MTKVVAFNGSARKDGNTAQMIRWVFDELEKNDIQTEMVQLAGKEVHGCAACYKCFKNQDRYCSVKNDAVNECIEKMVQAHGIILASPTYFADVSAEMKALIDRAGMVAKANGDLYKRKVGAAVVSVRRGGAVHAFDSMNHFFLISQMVIPGSCYWNLGFGLDKGDVTKDEEGERTMRLLGQNMAWVLQRLTG